MPEVANISVVGVLTGVFLLAFAFVAGVFVGGLVWWLAGATVTVLTLAVVSLVTPAHCTRIQYVRHRLEARGGAPVRLHDACQKRGGD